MTDTRALTIRQPWAAAITHGDKRVENRSRPAPASLHGTRILIHAGKGKPDPMGRFHIGQDVIANWPDTRGAITATATLTGSHPEASGCCAPWGFPNRHHWELTDVVPLTTPVPALGQLGLWRPTPEALTAVTTQLDAGASR
ncbi:hypothetical protein GCM10027160_24020 [Streptomyces calidiresistens]|uniref:ASCH domain-containing protein n=1 Tax=Streptomyces calidiresistens TaxID=1485586 RepID=UPI0015FC54A5|nr:ASCH domain-containing protein [Streptomyces calidiresistens]